MGKLYETGGQADVLISFKAPITINGRTYSEGEPYLYLSEVTYNFKFDEVDSSSEAGRNLIKFHRICPSAIALTDMALTDKICDLVLGRMETSSLPYMKRWSAKGNEDCIILPDEPVEEGLYIYESGNPVDYDRIEGNVIYGAFDLEKTYVIFYSSTVNGDVYSMEKTTMPYMSMQIIVKGNANKASARTLLLFPTVALNSVPVFGTSYSDIMKVPLVFDVINRGPGPVVLFE